MIGPYLDPNLSIYGGALVSDFGLIDDVSPWFVSNGTNLKYEYTVSVVGCTASPTMEPTLIPTLYPTTEPTMNPTQYPTEETSEPTTDPTEVPTKIPTTDPTIDPTAVPTSTPISPSTMTGDVMTPDGDVETVEMEENV